MNASSPEPLDQSQAYSRLSRLCDARDYGQLATEAARFVERFPDHGKAHHLLGFARLCLGDVFGGTDALRRASQLLPGDAEVFDHLGAASNMTGDFSAAQEYFRRALALDPGRPETHVNAGKNQEALGDARGAEEHYREALRLRPDMVDAHSNLSVALGMLGRNEEALAESEAAIRLSPGMASAHLHRGNALRDLGRMDDCLEAYDRALVINPQYPEGWNNLADVLCKMGFMGQAVEAAERGMRLQPDSPNLMMTLGTIYAATGRHEEATRLLREVAHRQPGNGRAWVNLGAILQDEAERGYCIEQYERAVDLDPDLHQALAILLFHRNYEVNADARDLLDLARRYGRLLSKACPRFSQWDNARDPEKRLRVGLVSADFCNHPVAYFLDGFLLAAQKKSVDWYAYANVRKEDEMTSRLRERFGKWRSIVHQPDDRVADWIREDGIDILIDLSGHTAESRLPLFARKPAPVQATWLGYVGTTGVEAIDWIIGDPYLFPEGEETHAVEKPWRLPECYMSLTTPPFQLECGEPPLFANGYPTFGCFNNLSKINDDVLALWADVLREVPDARLLLRAKQFGREMTKADFGRRLALAGIPVDRVEMATSLPSREAALAEYRRIDVALDTFPYTGMTTSAEALWMGVPVVTMRGRRMMERVGESLNRAVGLADCVAGDRADYVRCAARMARDAERLRRLRKSLRDLGSASPLGNPEWFANQFVAAMRGMWRQWCSAQKADHASR